LDDNGENCDVDEKWVSKHSVEDIEFLLELSGIDLVENLHENEGLEDVCEVAEFLGSITFWLLHWGVLCLFYILFFEESVITDKFLLFFLCIFDISLIFIWFLTFVEIANVMSKHFLVKIF